MELVSCHTHTFYSGHGSGTVEELVKAAKKAKLSTLAITEHFVLSDVWDKDHDFSLSWEELGQYKADIACAQKEHPDIEIVCGCEVDWLGEGEDRKLSDELWQDFHWILGSVHFLDGWPFDAPDEAQHWEEYGGIDAIWRRYFEEWCIAASSKWPFDVMAHPDLVKKFGFWPSFDPLPLYKEAIEAASSKGRMIELNTSGAYYPCEEMFPALDFLRLAHRANIPCSIGSDAHAPHLVDRGIKEGYRLLYEAGYREIVVPTQSGDRRTITIE